MTPPKITSKAPSKPQVEAEAYFLEVYSNGCEKCGSKRTWTIVGQDGETTGQSWGDEEEAAYICELMNEAFQRGKHP